MSNKTIGQWLKQSLKPYSPNMTQRMVKERLQAALEDLEATVDVESLTLEQVINITGCSEIEKWAKKDVSFLPWLLDTDYQSHRLKALFDLGLSQIEDILMSDYEPKVLSAKDKIAAFNILANLADKVPTKRKEVVYLDKSVGDMDDEAVARELAAAKKKLSSGQAPAGILENSASEQNKGLTEGEE
jgi:hypothetical protein